MVIDDDHLPTDKDPGMSKARANTPPEFPLTNHVHPTEAFVARAIEADTLERATNNLDHVLEHMSGYLPGPSTEPDVRSTAADTAKQIANAITALRASAFRSLAVTAAALERVVEGLGAIRFNDSLVTVTTSIDELLHQVAALEWGVPRQAPHRLQTGRREAGCISRDVDPASTSLRRLSRMCVDMGKVIQELDRAATRARGLGNYAMKAATGTDPARATLTEAAETVHEYAWSLAASLALLAEQMQAMQLIGTHALKAIDWAPAA